MENNNIICSDNRSNKQNKRWNKGYNPTRKVILWGWDNENNPSFLILYGKHEFCEGDNKLLKDNVVYDSYTIFKGINGHFPSFEAVKILTDFGYYDGRGNDILPQMYYKSGVKYNGWFWKVDDDFLVKDFKKLKEKEKISLPYFEEGNLYEDYILKLKEKNIVFPNFKMAESPEDVLNLSEEFKVYYKDIYEIISNPSIYMRKKYLRNLISKNPEKELYKLLLKIGSVELISGLFLELGKDKNPVLSEILNEESSSITKDKVFWAEDNYTKGLKRCIDIYLNSLNEELKEKRKEEIYNHLPEMDLNLIKVYDKDVPKNKIIEGATYRKYANQGLFKETVFNYDYNTREWKTKKASPRYEKSIYCDDGVSLNILEFKNTIQEAEVYGMADVIGKIAYYLDAPRLNYYFKGSENYKKLKYFRSYIRRIINSYAQNEPDKFIEAMKSLLTSYTEYDYVCKFKGNFQFNYFIKYYMYQDFKETPPDSSDWRNWSIRHEWMKNDQLMKLKGRYEYAHEIWDNHLKDVIYIASYSKIPVISKALYYILKDNINLVKEIADYKELIALSKSSYEDISSLFKKILLEKIDKKDEFDSSLMIALIESKDESFFNIAFDFQLRTNGHLNFNEMVILMNLEEIKNHKEAFENLLYSLDKDEYILFIKNILKGERNIKECGEFKDIILKSLFKFQKLSKEEKFNFVSYIILEILPKKNKNYEWIEEIISEIIFSLSYEEMSELVNSVNIDFENIIFTARNKQIISLLKSIKSSNIPSDSDILGILENGTSKMVKTLIDIIMKNEKKLYKRLSTILILLECNVNILNDKACEVFDKLPKYKHKKLHSMIIDSPIKRVYLFGIRKLDEIYSKIIPKKFIIQMLEHDQDEVKKYISDKTKEVLSSLKDSDKDLFIYYVKTLLYLPNKLSKEKDSIYNAIFNFALKYDDKIEEIENILLDIGSSNSIVDSERALVTLAKIRSEGRRYEG